MKYVNLTPHEINVFRAVVDADGMPTGEHVPVMSIPPSGDVARVPVENLYTFTDSCTGVEFYRPSTKGKPDLPEPMSGQWLIVSTQTREALPERSDLCSPGQLLRNADGQPIGCIGLVINKQR